MNVTIESVTRGEIDSCVKLSCGHEYTTFNPTLKAGYPSPCSQCVDTPQPCTDAQLTAVAAAYASLMRERGIAIGAPEEAAIRRAAAIHDVWRVAFKRVLG